MIKKFTKWILISLLISLAGLLIAYWSAPYWVPSKLQQFLPQTFKLDHVEIKRPGLTSAKIPKLSFAIDEESPVRIELENVQLNYSVWKQQLNSITANQAVIVITPNSRPNNTFSNKISIPKLPLEYIKISKLRLSGLLVQDILVNDLAIQNNKSEISVKGAVSLFGINFDTELKLHSQSQILKKLTAKINFLGDELNGSISPYSDNGFYWEIDSSLNNQAILPIDGIAPITIAGSGNFTKDKNLSISLEPNFSIQTQVDLETLSVQDQLKTFLKKQNISVNLSSLKNLAKLSIRTQENLRLTINDENHIAIQHGSLPLSIDHPLLTLALNLNKFELDANQSLSDPSQSFAGNISLNISFPDFIYQDKATGLFTSQVNLILDTNFQIQDSLLKAKSKKIEVALETSTLELSQVSIKLPNMQWDGSFEMVQSLVGESKPDHLSLDLKQMAPINLQLKHKVDNIALNNITNNFSLENDQLKIITKSKTTKLEKQPLTSKRLSATTRVTLTTKKVDGNALIQSIDFLNSQAHLADLSTQFNWSWYKDSFSAKGTITKDDLAIPFNYRFNLKSGNHQVGTTNSNINASQLADWLNPIISKYPKLQIIDGLFTGKNIQLDPISLAGSGQAHLQNLNLLYDELSINNLNISDALSDRAPLTGNANISIESLQLASGISINNFATSLNHRNSVYRFKDIKANLLDGSMNIDKLTISPKLITPFTVELNAINFTPLLEAFESESLSIAGKFDFVLPIHINDKGQAINDGTFSSIEAGVLKVKTAQATDANIAFQALDNFHYNSLSGTINYSADGIYRLKVNLVGNNPNLYDGFPIELTLNIEGNLPNLLHSMVFSGDMAKPIIDRYHSGHFDLPETSEEQSDN